METALAYKSMNAQKGINQYQQNVILNATPEELILKLYDLGILSIRRNDFEKANLVLTELISALNFEYQEEALGLFKLYRYCQDCLYKGNTKEPIHILSELRETWAKAFNLA
ncbi:MAG: flagellar protein FliS [Calditrichaeota bacterium]|nr:MAG: flagellar protein FliS [Calditrichota bacterium]